MAQVVVNFAKPVALLATGLATGAALYITLVEHPTRSYLPSAVALQQWKPSYSRAAVMQGVLITSG